MLTALLALALAYMALDKVKAILQGKEDKTLRTVKKAIISGYSKIAKKNNGE